MAWQEVETDIGDKAPGRVKYSVKDRTGPSISVPPGILAELRWTAETRFKLQVGAGERDGMLRLVADAKGKIKGKVALKSMGMLIRLGRWPSLAPREVDKLSVDHEVEVNPTIGNALIVTLPRHALAVAPKARDYVAAKVDVTERVAGRDGARFSMASGTRR